MQDFFRSFGRKAEAENIKRSLSNLVSPQGVKICVDGKHYHNFSSNNYLGLCAHEPTLKRLAESVHTLGFGSGASHLLTGHHEEHQALEESLAAFIGAPKALFFSCGYMANMGVQEAFLGRKDYALHDRLNHASLLDGVRLSGAILKRYPHLAPEKAASMIDKPHAKVMLATDTVFSMDGDVADLAVCDRLCREKNWLFLMDDAHGLGVLGERGEGAWGSHSFDLDRTLYMGTLGKAVGGSGAFVAGSKDAIDALIQRVRTYIFTTASPPLVALGNRLNLEALQQSPWRIEKLRENVAHFRKCIASEGFSSLGIEGIPIQPVMIGDEKKAMLLSKVLMEKGFLAKAIRFPTVAKGKARIRFTLSSSHDKETITLLIKALKEAWHGVMG